MIALFYTVYEYREQKTRQDKLGCRFLQCADCDDVWRKSSVWSARERRNRRKR